MSIPRLLARILMCALLEFGALSGARIHPEDIEAVMKLSLPQVVCMQKEDADGPPEPL